MPTNDEIAIRRLTPSDPDFRWTNLSSGADVANQLSELTDNLRDTERGKRIESGFSYWGVESTVAWGEAVSDSFYPLMRESHDSFGRRWGEVSAVVIDRGLHYVSLGPGTGQKDYLVVSDLLRQKPDMAFIPVDMSPEMMRFLTKDPWRSLPLHPIRLMPLQLDFSNESNLIALRNWLDWVLEGERFFFSLLGNTLANFEDDRDWFTMMTEILLRPDDRLMLEIATTSSTSQAEVSRARNEYRQSRRFREFITSSLQHYTDLTIDVYGPSLQFDATVDDGHAIVVTMRYQNMTDATINITLPDRTTMAFPPNDTIRLLMTRKYIPDGIKALIKSAGLRAEGSQHSNFTASGRTRMGQFGMDLLVLSRPAPDAPKPTPAQVLASGRGRK